MNNYKCLDDNSCNVLYNHELFNSSDLIILKPDEFIVTHAEVQALSDTLAQDFIASIFSVSIILIMLFLTYLYFRNKLSSSKIKD